MTTGDLMTNLQKHFATANDMKQAVQDHRQQNINWNWVDAASNLLKELEV
jgi:hypothetical protein